jgi:hypothetical protein
MIHGNGGTDDTPESVPAADLGLQVASVALTGVSLLLIGGLLTLIVNTRSSFEKMLAEFNVVLPQIAYVAESLWLVWIVATLLALTALKEFLVRSRTARAVCNASAIFVALVVGGVYAVGMFLPLMTLVKNLSR